MAVSLTDWPIFSISIFVCLTIRLLVNQYRTNCKLKGKYTKQFFKTCIPYVPPNSQFSGPNFLIKFSGVSLFSEYTLNQTILEIKMSLRVNSQHFPLFRTLTYLFTLCTTIFCPLHNWYRIWTCD